MAFLRNCWYAAAWSYEIGRSLFARTVLDEPLVVATATGTVVAPPPR